MGTFLVTFGPSDAGRSGEPWRKHSGYVTLEAKDLRQAIEAAGEVLGDNYSMVYVEGEISPEAAARHFPLGEIARIARDPESGMWEVKFRA